MGNTITLSSLDSAERILTIGDQKIWLGSTSATNFFAAYSEVKNDLIYLRLSITNNLCIFTSRGVHEHRKYIFVYELRSTDKTGTNNASGNTFSLGIELVQTKKLFYKNPFIQKEYLKIIRNLSPPLAYL